MTEFAYAEFLSRVAQLPRIDPNDPDDRPPDNWASICLEPLGILGIIKDESLKNTLRKKYLAEVAPPTQKKEPCTYFYITINPHPKIRFPEFRAKVTRFLESKLYADHLAVFEQRGTILADTLGKGFHSHILLKRKTPVNEGLPPSNIESKVRRSFTNYVKKCGNCTSKLKCNHTLNFQSLGDSFAADKVEYLLGEKSLPGKPEKQLGDLEWRSDNKIPHPLGNPNITDSKKGTDPILTEIANYLQNH